LASDTDVAALARRALTIEEQGAVPLLLAKASAQFRRLAEQQFTPGESVARLKVNARAVCLWERPAGVVHSVADDQGRPVAHTRRGQWLRDVPLPSSAYVTVEYSHGSETVPDLVRVTVAEIVARTLGLDEAARSGVIQQSKTVGPFNTSRTFAAWASGGQLTFSPDDRRVALSFRPQVPRLWAPA
jgi:hypothetical protein